MSNYIQLSNNLDQLKLTKIKEYLPSFLDDAISKDLSFVDVLLELTNKEIDFREKRAAEINLAISNFPFIIISLLLKDYLTSTFLISPLFLKIKY